MGIRDRWSLWVAGLVLLPLCVALAEYRVNWSSWSSAVGSGQPFIVSLKYREGKAAFTEKKHVQEYSGRYPFVQFDSISEIRGLREEERRMVEKLELDGKHLVLLDEYGNELDRLGLFSVSEGALKRLFETAPKKSEQVQEKLGKILEDAVEREERGHFKRAIELYHRIVDDYFGYPVVKEAARRLEDLLSGVRDTVRTLCSGAYTKDAYNELRKMEREYRGTELEPDLKEAMEEIEAKK